MVFSRTFNIKRGDLGGNQVTLLLCFQVADPSRLYHDQFSIAWRVADFTGQGHENMSATYISQLFMANPQLTVGNHVKPNHWIEIDPGQHTILEKNDSGVRFTAPVNGNGKHIIAENDTGSRQDFGIGIVEGEDTAAPLLYFSDIGQGSGLAVQFKLLLQAYIVSGYQETMLLRGAIETRKPFWSIDVTGLPPGY